MSSCACGADSVGDAGSAGGAGSSGLVPLVMWVLLVLLMELLLLVTMVPRVMLVNACFLLMMLASDFDAGSAGVFCWGCLFLPVFANDASFWF